LFWKTLISSQKELLASAWGSTVDDVDAYYEHISHDAHVGVRIGEAKNPGPRVRASQRLRRPSKIWTCNTGGAPKAWPLLSLLKIHQPHVVMLQEAAFKPSEWATFQANARIGGYHGFFSGTHKDRPHGGAAVLSSF
jgi:hypothetical protein